MKSRQISEAAMTIIESMGLRRGRGQTNSVVSRSAAKQPSAEGTGPTRQSACAVVTVNGPINRFMFLEGRSWALDLVASLRASPVALVIERLAGAAVDRPGSYAAGIQSVIKDLEVASQ